ADKVARRFRIAADAPVKTFPHPNLVNSVAFDNTGNLLASGGQDGVLRVFDLAKGTATKTINAHVVTMPQQVQNPIYTVLWSNDNKQLFTSSYDKSIKLWDATSGNLVREFKPAPDPMPEVKKDDKKDDKKDGKEPPKKDDGPPGH